MHLAPKNGAVALKDPFTTLREIAYGVILVDKGQVEWYGIENGGEFGWAETAGRQLDTLLLVGGRICVALDLRSLFVGGVIETETYR